MTKDEILNRIKAYESKWGKLGESKSIMHSSIENKNTKRKDNKTMLRMDNDFYAYRQKVLAGKEANRLSHSATIDVNELNKRHYQEMIDNNVIIHNAPDDDVPQGYIRIRKRPKQEEEVTYGRENMYARRKEVEMMNESLSHSADEYEGVMDEYHEFMARVKKGKEANRLAHSSYVSADELNRKYYEQLYENAFIVHSGSNNQQYGSYYHKIDDYYGKGKHKYFETKEEYDAYVENQNREAKKTAEVKEAERGNDMNGYNTWKQQQEAKKQQAQKDTARKQSGMEGYEDWKSSKDKSDRQKEEAYNKNKDLEKAGQESDVIKKYSEIIRSSSPEAAAKVYLNDKKVTDFINKLEKRYKSGALETYQSKFDD